jgi:hypothetical protein
VSEFTTEGAFALLRPVLQNLKVQELKEIPRVYRASSSIHLKANGFGRWVIIAKQTTFPDNTKGSTIITFDKTHNLFLLFVYVDKNLFKNDKTELRTQRKMVAVHEFVHCAAHMFLMNYFGDKKYIELTGNLINDKVKLTTLDQFNEMVSAIGKLGTKDGSRHEIFTDGHFRLLEEKLKDGFLGNFAELYTNLLLSYQLISETMANIKQLCKNGRIELAELLTLTFRELVEKKALDKEFVLGRIKLYLPALFVEFA